MKNSEDNNAALEAIKFVIDNPDKSPFEFLKCWYDGDFETIRSEWKNVPDEVFIGVDPIFKIGSVCE